MDEGKRRASEAPTKPEARTRPKTGSSAALVGFLDAKKMMALEDGDEDGDECGDKELFEEVLELEGDVARQENPIYE